MRSNQNSLEWLTRFREWVYQNHRSVALAAEEALLTQNGAITDSVVYGASPPPNRRGCGRHAGWKSDCDDCHQGFYFGKEIEPGYISPEFQAKLDTLRGK